MADNNTPKDLDFDELHNAVNALMDQATKGKTKRIRGKPQAKTSTHKTEPKAAQTEETEDNAIPVRVERLLPPLTKHTASHGRAMDIVGPKTADTSTTSTLPKREAPPLQPTKLVEPEPIKPIPMPTFTEEPAAEPKEPSDDVLASLDMQSPPTVQPEPTMTHEKPDLAPVAEITGFKDDQPGGSLPAEDKPASNVEAPWVEPTQPDLNETAEVEAESTPPEPAQTPFVTTKVEKRPLGAYSQTAPAEPQPTPEDPAQPAAKTDASGANEAETLNPLPAQAQPEELSAEVVAVESSEPQFVGGDSQTDDMLPKDIPQQYKDAEQPISTAPRPVFDTKDYHTAIDTPVVHKRGLPGWLIALIAVVLLIIVLGATYYLITGTFDFSALL